jgi:hypothetical protein
VVSATEIARAKRSIGSDTVLDDDIFVILAVSNLHEGCWTFACAVRTARGLCRP